MLKAISKAAFRVRSVDTAISTLKLAVQTALTAPAGPVSVEIPIDIQSALINLPADLSPLPVPVARPSEQALDDQPSVSPRRGDRCSGWGRCPACRPAVQRLLAMGVGVVTSTQGRGIVPEDDTRSLGAFNLNKPVERFYQTRRHARGGLAPARQRNPQVRTQAPASALPGRRRCHGGGPLLPQRFLRLRRFRTGPQGLADRLEGRLSVDPAFAADLAAARRPAPSWWTAWPLRFAGGATAALAGRNFNWVRDVTVSNSTWGNRHLNIFRRPRRCIGQPGHGHQRGGRRGGNRAWAQDLRARRRRRLHPQPGRTGHRRAGAGRHAHRADERPGLRGDQEHPGRRLRWPPLLRRPAHGLRPTVGFPRPASCQGQRPEGFQRRARWRPGRGPFLLEVDMLAVGSFKSIFAGPPTNDAKTDKATA